MELGEDFDLMVDFMINHLSRQSPQFQDFKQNKDQSLTGICSSDTRTSGGGEPTAEDLGRSTSANPVRPMWRSPLPMGAGKDLAPLMKSEIDLDVISKVTRDFIRDSLLFLAEKKAAIVRLDAFAYATKKLGTNCFFVEPEVWELLEFTRDVLAPQGVEILPEIHEHYTIQLKLAERGYWVYDFALPMLLLYSLYTGRNERLLNWLRICPRKQFTTLDTHDGIGVVDVHDLLTSQEIEETKAYLFSRGANVKPIYNTTAYNNLDVYQLNCTYYSALGNNDAAYLLARAISSLPPAFPRFTMWAFWLGKMIWNFWKRLRGKEHQPPLLQLRRGGTGNGKACGAAPV